MDLKKEDRWQVSFDGLDQTSTSEYDYTESTASAGSYDYAGPLGHQFDDTVTLSSTLGSANSGLGSISLSSPYTVTGSVSSPAYSIGTGISSPWMTQGANGTSGRISLTGNNADVEVNGWSLVAAVKRIEERLGLFQPNPKLEAEWEDLKALAEQYRKLEQHIKDKQATWDRLKAMPAPEID
jgi:hypothetical protein